MVRLGKSLVHDLAHKESEEVAEKLLFHALRGEEDKNVELRLRTFGQKVVMDKFIHIQGDYKAIVHSPNPLIPPIFGSDENICCSEWNIAMEKLTGWSRGDVVGKMLVGEIFGSCCRLKGPDSMTTFMIWKLPALNGCLNPCLLL